MALKRCIVFIVFTFLTLVETVGYTYYVISPERQLGAWECNEDSGFYLDINDETITYTDKKTGRYIIFPVISQCIEAVSSNDKFEGVFKIGAPVAQTMPVNEINTKLYENILFWQNYSGLKDPEYGYIFFFTNMKKMLLFNEDIDPDDCFALNSENEIEYFRGVFSCIYSYSINDFSSMYFFNDFSFLDLIPIYQNKASDAVFHRISTIAPFKEIFEKRFGKLHDPSPDGYWYEGKAGNDDYYLDIDTTTITYTDVNSGEYVVYPYEEFSEYSSDGYLITSIKLGSATERTIPLIRTYPEGGFLGMLQSHSETGEPVYYTCTVDSKNMIFCWFSGRQSKYGKYITYTKILTEKELPPVEPEEPEEVEELESSDSTDAEESQSPIVKNKVNKTKNDVLKNISAKLHEWLKIFTEKLSDLMKFLSELSAIYLIILYLITVNIVEFIMFGVDKYRSQYSKSKDKSHGNKCKDNSQQSKWRIRETSLILIATIGGSIGAILGMFIFHHKSQKEKFQLGLPMILLLQIMCLMCGIMIWVVLTKLN